MAKDHSGRLWVFQDGSGSFRMAQDHGGRLRRITWRAERADLRREEAGIASFVAAGIDESAFAIVIERHEATGTHPTADRNRAGRNYPILPDDGPILPPIQDPPPTAPPTAAAAAAAAAVTPLTDPFTSALALPTSLPFVLLCCHIHGQITEQAAPVPLFDLFFSLL